MAATDARPVPRKNVAYRVTFPILDADGDLVTGATALDSEVSIDGGTFADCTNEATEIATGSGVYYLDLTAGEMNGDTVAVIVKTSTAGAKTTTIVMYPEEAGDYRADVTHFGGTAGTFSAGRPEVNTSHAAGTAWGSGAITAASIAASALNGKGDWNIGKTGYSLTATTGLGNQTANITGNLSGSVGSVTAGVTLAASAVQAIWDALTTALTTVGSVGKLIVDNLNATVSSRSSHSAADVWASATRTLTSAANITSTGGTTVPQTGDSFARLGAPAGASIAADIDAIPTAVENADTLLDRNMGTGTDSGSPTVRTVRQALRFLRNKWSISGGTLTVTKEDDTTASWTGAVTTTAGNPVSAVDPASS